MTKVFDRDLPDVRDLELALRVRKRERLKPFLVGGALVATGALLLNTNPRLGAVPDPKPYGARRRKATRKRVAERMRDGVASFAPSNLTDQLGKSLLMGGAAMLIARVLDEYVGPDDD